METVSTFKDDLIGLSNFAQRLEDFITVEQHFVEGGLVVGLSSRFGSGKTTFLRMWRSSIATGNSNLKDSAVVSLNAWESDYYGDPLFAIVSELADCAKASDEESANRLIDAAKDVGWFATAVGGQLAKKFTGVDPTAAGDFAQKKRDEREEREETESSDTDTFTLYEGRKKAMAELKEAIAEFVNGFESQVLFLVDELDRCRPDYAISYLETIKHIFDTPGAVFILAADRRQLENSARMAFGNDLDFDEYYRKFVHREVTLPSVSDAGHQKLAQEYVRYYLERQDIRFCYMDTSADQVEKLVSLVAALKLTPRQIQEVFRILGHLCQTSEDNEGHLGWTRASRSIAMAAFKAVKPEVFHQLGSTTFDPKRAVELLQELFSEALDVEWWFMLLLTGKGIQKAEHEALGEIIERSGLLTITYEDSGSTVEILINRWGRYATNEIPVIYDKIMHVNRWG